MTHDDQLPSDDEVRPIAERIWRERGCPEGQDIDIWLAAVQEVRRSSLMASMATSRLTLGELETALKIILGATGFFYALGLVGINYYLWRFRVSDFSLVQPQFLFSGSLLAFPVLAIIGCWQAAFLAFNIKSHPGWMKRVNFIFWMSAPLITIVLLTLGNGEVGLIERGLIAGKLWFAALLVGVSAFGALAILLTEYPMHMEEETPSLPRGIVRIAWSAGFMAFFLASFVWYLAMFSAEVYPFVPQQFGGAQAVNAKLLFDKDSVESAKEAGIKFEGKNLSTKVRIVFELSNSYLIKVDNGNIVQINRDNITGVMRTLASDEEK